MADRAARDGQEPEARHQGDGRADEGFGDDQGTRVGRPDPGPDPSHVDAAPSSATGASNDRANTGAGAEAAEGMHSSKGRSPEERSGVERAHGEPGRGEGAGLPGSEPLRHRETEHKSGYGGEKGEPKTSSDQR